VNCLDFDRRTSHNAATLNTTPAPQKIPFMKLQALSVSVLVAMLMPHGLANEPPPSNTAQSSATSSGTSVTVTKGVSPARQKYTKKRIIVLKQQIHDYKHAQKTADKLDLMLGTYSNPSRELMRRYLINRFELLALKAERGRATRDDLNELRQLQQILLGH